MPTGDIFDLSFRYLDAQLAPLYNGTTSVTPLIDGKTYFTELFNVIESTGAGDFVYLTDWGFEDAVIDDGTTAIGQLLAEKAAAGVDVRLILSGGLWSQYQSLGPFAGNLQSARRLRTLVVKNTMPLSNRVLLDWSGQRLTGTHHQKSGIIQTQNETQAFVSGLDFIQSRYDAPPHNTMHWGAPTGPPWGWHDIGVKLGGRAVARVWENFRSRWTEAMTLPDVDYYYDFFSSNVMGHPVAWKSDSVNPQPIDAVPTPGPTCPAVSASNLAVQVLRSRYPYKRNPQMHWSDDPPTAGIREIFQVLRKAINAASKYIYIEDQYLADTPTGLDWIGDYSLFPLLLAAATRGVKVILLGSDRSDPTDDGAGPRNQTITGAGDVHEKLIVPLTSLGRQNNVVVWRLKNATVHAKLMIIDDVFASIGSANMHTRSMYGVDSELQVAFVDANFSPNSVVHNLRIDIWSEHLRLTPNQQSVLRSDLEGLPSALGIWRNSWLHPTLDKRTWRTANYPGGFQPSASALVPVVPGD